MDLTDPLQRLLEQTITFLPKLVTAIVTFIISLVVSGLAANWVQRAAEREGIDLPYPIQTVRLENAAEARGDNVDSVPL